MDLEGEGEREVLPDWAYDGSVGGSIHLSVDNDRMVTDYREREAANVGRDVNVVEGPTMKMMVRSLSPFSSFQVNAIYDSVVVHDNNGTVYNNSATIHNEGGHFA
ncbi:hypothetical protein Peur_020650 [Populus x canadensis]